MSDSIIFIVGVAAGIGTDKLAGSWLKEYNPDGNGGRGHVLGTKDRDMAMRFPDAGAALNCWRQTSTVLPLRPDGKPNRPLTAFTIEVQPYVKPSLAS